MGVYSDADSDPGSRERGGTIVVQEKPVKEKERKLRLGLGAECTHIYTKDQFL